MIGWNRIMFDSLGWFRAGRLALTVVALLAVSMARTGVRETTYTVGRRARISITNCCGPITVKPSGRRLVVAKTLSHSEEVNFVNEQRGERVKLRSESNRQGDNLAEYTVLVPADAIVTLRSANGMIDVEGLRGDVIVEAMTASVHIDNISGAHLHVRTLSGPITLANIGRCHVDVGSVSGNVDLHNVSESSVKVNSGTGRIAYQGDPGSDGDYLLTTYSGDLDLSIPARAVVDVKSRSMNSELNQGKSISSGVSEAGTGNHLLKSRTIGIPRFVLRTFRGRIGLKRP